MRKIPIEIVFKHGGGDFAPHGRVHFVERRSPAACCEEPGIFKVGGLVVVLPGWEKEEIEQPLEECDY